MVLKVIPVICDMKLHKINNDLKPAILVYFTYRGDILDVRDVLGYLQSISSVWLYILTA